VCPTLRQKKRPLLQAAVPLKKMFKKRIIWVLRVVYLAHRIHPHSLKSIKMNKIHSEKRKKQKEREEKKRTTVVVIQAIKRDLLAVKTLELAVFVLILCRVARIASMN
jgi:hypothetical protein